MLTTIILRYLGYPVDLGSYDNSVNILITKGFTPFKSIHSIRNCILTNYDVGAIFYSSMTAVFTNGEKVASRISSADWFNRSKAVEYGLIVDQ